MMNAKDRARAARKSLADAAHQFNEGNDLKGSQKCGTRRSMPCSP